ncbi:MAG: DNA polymerase III subunit delta [Saezia sp.]
MAELSVEQLVSHLSKEVRPLYVLCGEEPLQQQECADAIRRTISKDAEVERSSFTVLGAHFDWSPVMAALSGLSLFAQQQLIEIYIPSGKPGREGGAVLQELAGKTSQMEGVCVLLVLPQALDRTTKNTAWFKALSQFGVIVNCRPIDVHMLPQWLMQRMMRVGIQLKPGDEGKKTLSFLAEHVEGNLLAAHQEIEKFSLLYGSGAGSPHTISYEEVQKAVNNVARYDLFGLPQAVFSGQLDRAMKMLDGLISEGQSVVRIHWVLSNEVMSLWRARQLLDEGKPLPLALREAKVWGERERMFEQVLPRVSARACLRLLRFSQICDGLVKGLRYPGWPDHAVGALQKLVLEMIDAVGVARAGQQEKPMIALKGV